MERYDVYMYNVPKVGPDDKVIPIDPPQTEEFPSLEEAQKFAAQHKGKFERITLIRTQDDKQRMLERYTDGMHEVREYKETEKDDESASEDSAESASA